MEKVCHQKMCEDLKKIMQILCYCIYFNILTGCSISYTKTAINKNVDKDTLDRLYLPLIGNTDYQTTETSEAVLAKLYL